MNKVGGLQPLFGLYPKPLCHPPRYKPLKGQIPKKPRTYRNLARKDYLLIAKQRRLSRNKKRQGIKKQLQYIKRNLAHIKQLIELGATLENLNKKQYKTLLVLTEIYRQQQCLFNNNKQSIEDRIVIQFSKVMQ
jgi:hypothetical protein